MKHYTFKITIAFISLSFLVVTCVHSQNHMLKGQLLDRDSKTGIIGAYINLYKDTVLVKSTMTDQYGFFILNDVTSGEFDLHVLQIAMRTYKLTKIQLPIDTNLIICYPPPCIFNSRKPNTCLGGHTDKIIPIVYGLPTKKTLYKAKKGKVFLGGCIVSSCDPNFYCTLHKKEL